MEDCTMNKKEYTKPEVRAINIDGDDLMIITGSGDGGSINLTYDNEGNAYDEGMARNFDLWNSPDDE